LHNLPTSEESSHSVPNCLLDPLQRAKDLLSETLGSWQEVGLQEGLQAQLAGGKALRPALAIWWGKQIDASPTLSEQWGLAVELLHNAFLIHDDIEDGDRWRRGLPTLWVSAGIPIALNVADFLVAEAYRIVATLVDTSPDTLVQLQRDFSETHRTTVLGQALDLHHRADPEFTISDYEQIIRKKTGRYLALAWIGPARFAAWSQDLVDALWQLGDELGPAFQIRDDVLDLSPGKGRGGEIGCDIREGKPSILVAHALQSEEISSEQKGRLLEVLGKPREETTPQEVDWVVRLFEVMGSVSFGNDEARRRRTKGSSIFSSLPGISSTSVSEFESIASYLIDRKV